MAGRHVIVDGSNLATEGRSMPSLGQLDQAVREFIAENPADDVTVVVDASFGHRIDPSELPMFEEAETAGEVVSPPAGAIGRGDAFLLRIAEKTGATVLSNDSFQEFHVEHAWLFDKGRLIGGKPVPGVGWIFMERSPVRGPKSREVTKEAKRRKKSDTDRAASESSTSRARQRPKVVDRAIARATAEVVEPKSARKSRRRRGTEPPSEPVNEPLTFITFIASHPLGTEVIGAAIEYSSHGAFVVADGARCYIPLSAMADPPPRRAREVVAKGEEMAFVVQAFDPPRRGIELALPGFAQLSGTPTAETVDAEIHQDLARLPAGRPRVSAVSSTTESARGTDRAASPTAPVSIAELTVAQPPAARGRRSRPAASLDEPPFLAAPPVVVDSVPSGASSEQPPAKRTRARKASASSDLAEVTDASRTGVAKKAPARKAPAKKSAARTAPVPSTPDGAAEAPGSALSSTDAAASNAPAEKVRARKAPAKKSPTDKSPATKAPAKKIGAEKTTSTEVPASKTPAKATPARKASATTGTSTAKEPPVAKKAPPRKSSAGKASSTAKTPVPAKATAKRPAAAGAATSEIPADGGQAQPTAGAKKAAARRAPAKKVSAT